MQQEDSFQYMNTIKSKPPNLVFPLDLIFFFFVMFWVAIAFYLVTGNTIPQLQEQYNRVFSVYPLYFSMDTKCIASNAEVISTVSGFLSVISITVSILWGSFYKT